MTVDELLNGMLARPEGQISPSVYETARLVALAPWLPGHDERISFLLAQQRPDCLWGGPGPYALVPSLSAIDALCGSAAARRALPGVRALLSAELPDTVAAEFLVPALTLSINRRLPPGEQLPPHPGAEPTTLAAVRQLLASSGPVPRKLWHTLEIAPNLVAGASTVRPEGGLVGASPAATAAWLGRRPSAGLAELVRRHGGPVPSVVPITNFERAWVACSLGPSAFGVPLAATDAAINGGDGLPPDADTTSANLYASALRGQGCDPAPLWGFEVDTHFTTWHGERTPSPTTNAHVLEALGVSAPSERVRAAVTKVSSWLIDCQHPSGWWTDKWHASPYYATAACVAALSRFGGAAAVDAVLWAASWVLDTQHPDGSWGRWGGTAEETAYAVQILVRGGLPDPRTLARARSFLADVAQPHPPLWHDKDLYAPYAVIDAAVLAAEQLLDSRVLEGIGHGA